MTTPMLTQTSTTMVVPSCAIDDVAIRPTNAGTVVVVDGGEHVIDLLESVFGAGPFDVVLVESSANAYSRIRRAQPALIIVSVNFEDPTGFQVLSMLALDKATSHIPVLIHVAESPRRLDTTALQAAVL
jgi:CheY-like chemotaxis protein